METAISGFIRLPSEVRVKIRLRHVLALAAALMAVALAALPAAAHPHVWVTYRTTVMYENGSITGFDHVWTFDDMYTAMAIQGLDKNGDGVYDRDELAELAQINMDGLKDFEYFTFAKLGEQPIKIAKTADYWLEHKDGILKLHFKAILESPVLIDAAGFNFAVYDPSYFIAFEPEKDNPITLAASAPKECTAGFKAANAAATDLELKEKLLNDAFAVELGKAQDVGAGFSTTAVVTCSKP